MCFVMGKLNILIKFTDLVSNMLKYKYCIGILRFIGITNLSVCVSIFFIVIATENIFLVQ